MIKKKHRRSYLYIKNIPGDYQWGVNVRGSPAILKTVNRYQLARQSVWRVISGLIAKKYIKSLKYFANK